MARCGAYIPVQIAPPMHWTPLRASAHLFAADAGHTGGYVKIIESKQAAGKHVIGWDVYVKDIGAAKGKCIGTMLQRACDAFGHYAY